MLPVQTVTISIGMNRGYLGCVSSRFARSPNADEREAANACQRGIHHRDSVGVEIEIGHAGSSSLESFDETRSDLVND